MQRDHTADNRADYWKIYGGALLLTLIGFVVAYQFVEPAPPSRVVMSTGGPDGAYHRFAQRYATLLAENGITLELRNSAGTVENLARLSKDNADGDAEVQIALVQSGVVASTKDTHLRALGSVYYEPLWVFHRRDLEVTTLGDLSGTRIALGGAGSGTRAVMVKLLRSNGVDTTNSQWLDLGGKAAAQALLAGEVDVATFVSAASAAAVHALLGDERVQLLSFSRAEAYARLYPFLNHVTLPRGVMSLAADRPVADIHLLAPAATLVVRESLHPAVVSLLLQAARKTHSAGTLVSPPESFPSPQMVDFELRDEAVRYYESGPPFLQRFLPFWAANLIDRMKVLLLPLLTVLFPMFKIVPPFYSWRIRRRIYRRYREVREIEIDYLAAPSVEARTRSLATLDAIEAELVALKVPLGVSDALYHLRLHIRFVRDELHEVS